MSYDLPSGRGYLIDLDGTLISGGEVFADSARLLDALRGRFAIVSNNAEHTPAQLARWLRARGLDLRAQDLILAGTAAIERVARRREGARVLLLGSAALRGHARRRGLVLDEAASDVVPDVVLVARDRQFSYRKLALAARAVAAGATLVIAAPDRNHPGPGGVPVPETGALAAAILAAAGGAAAQEVIGKPEPALFEMGCARLGLPPGQVTMIGDNPDTDGLGAERMGMAFLQVQPGQLPVAALSDPR